MFEDIRSLDPLHRIFIEACIVGLLVMLVGSVASKLVKPYFGITLPEICKSWNKKYVMEVSLFMTGFLLHVLLEWTGINKQYAVYRGAF
jgi:cation transporter-like permease